MAHGTVTRKRRRTHCQHLHGETRSGKSNEMRSRDYCTLLVLRPPFCNAHAATMYSTSTVQYLLPAAGTCTGSCLSACGRQARGGKITTSVLSAPATRQVSGSRRSGRNIPRRCQPVCAHSPKDLRHCVARVRSRRGGNREGRRPPFPIQSARLGGALELTPVSPASPRCISHLRPPNRRPDPVYPACPAPVLPPTTSPHSTPLQ